MTAGDVPLVLPLALSVVLLLVHVMLQGMLATRELGRRWNAGPRDENLRPAGILFGRAERASANFRETYPAFVALSAGLLATGDPSGFGLIGAWLWFASRIVYLPLYLGGVPYVRSLVWLASCAGLAMMFTVLVF